MLWQKTPKSNTVVAKCSLTCLSHKRNTQKSSLQTDTRGSEHSKRRMQLRKQETEGHDEAPAELEIRVPTFKQQCQKKRIQRGAHT